MNGLCILYLHGNIHKFFIRGQLKMSYPTIITKLHESKIRLFAERKDSSSGQRLM